MTSCSARVTRPTHLFIIVSGRFRLAETGIEINPPDVVGEFALLAPDRRCTQTVECVEAGALLQIGYRQSSSSTSKIRSSDSTSSNW